GVGPPPPASLRLCRGRHGDGGAGALGGGGGMEATHPLRRIGFGGEADRGWIDASLAFSPTKRKGGGPVSVEVFQPHAVVRVCAKALLSRFGRRAFPVLCENGPIIEEQAKTTGAVDREAVGPLLVGVDSAGPTDGKTLGKIRSRPVCPVEIDPRIRSGERGRAL